MGSDNTPMLYQAKTQLQSTNTQYFLIMLLSQLATVHALRFTLLNLQGVIKPLYKLESSGEMRVYGLKNAVLVNNSS